MRFLLPSLFLLFFPLFIWLGQPKVSLPLVWDMEKLEQMRTENSFQKEYKSILEAGDDYCALTPLSVTDKQRNFAPDNHYYCSLAPYWWPDSLDSGKYVNKDGIVNPEREYYDRDKLAQVAERCKTLSMAFFLTRESKYFDAFIEQIETWFINKDTYMYPNLEYAQVIPGRNGNKGRSTGMIDAYSFNTIIESIRLTNSVRIIKKKTLRSLQLWFHSFAKWADNGEFSGALKRGNNNIALAYDVTLVNLYLFAGNVYRARAIADVFIDRRVKVQILEDGSQPAELKRTKAFSYSLYNLEHIIDFCFLARYWDNDYYTKNGSRIDKAISYLEQYVDDMESFPYQQIQGGSGIKKRLVEIINRRNKLVNSVR